MKIGLLKARTAWWCRLTDYFSGHRGYGHAALFLDNGWQITSMTDGVYFGPDNHKEEDWAVIDLGPMDDMVAINFWAKECLCGYDWRGLIHFIMPYVKPAKDRWFCSEIVMAILQQYGFAPHVSPATISPNDLWLLFADKDVNYADIR